ncbi:unnamed protein product [Paramecium pentaurelia]|uniref:Uncharacterized protein n=1 Tax=Paramecium pentaurelia TaxID=43138 RepID=A0A8S1YEH0_9CILI|nr:unnamed protein product [Paramecium pentaurelia]
MSWVYGEYKIQMMRILKKVKNFIMEFLFHLIPISLNTGGRLSSSNEEQFHFGNKEMKISLQSLFQLILKLAKNTSNEAIDKIQQAFEFRL